MYTTLIAQQWKKTVRSRYFSQGWGLKILAAFLVLYFGLSFLALGILLPELIAEAYPEANQVTPLFGEFILYYMLVDLAIRFFLQDLNLLKVQHYLMQPVPKSKVINFLLGGSVFNFFNLFPLLFIVPFTIRAVAPELGTETAWVWVLSMVGLVLFDHFTAIYIKRVVAVKQVVFVGFAAVVGLLLLGNSFGWFSLNNWSSLIFAPLGKLWFLAVPWAGMALLYWFNYHFLLAQSYIDQWKKHTKEAATQNFKLLESKGAIGTMMANELKLIIRNKRTRSIVFMCFFACLYGLMFYSTDISLEGVYGMGGKVFAGIFMTGIFLINYGQFMVGWESAYFDGILTRAYSMDSFFRAKFWLLVTSCLITYLLSLGYIYFTWDALWINTACFIYNIGVNSFVLMFFSTYQKKRIDLSRGSAFNYQGTSAVQFLVALPLLVVPMLIFQAFNVFDRPYYGLVALAASGLISLAFSKYWFSQIVQNFAEKKYRNAAGFRGDS